MLLDAQCLFTDTATTLPGYQTIGTGATSYVSYNQLDLGIGTYANGVDGAAPIRSPGNGQPLYLVQQVITNATSGMTGATLNTKLVASTTSTFDTSLIIAQTGVVARARMSDNMLMVIPVPPTIGYRYWRVEWATNNNDNVYVLKTFLSALAPSPLYMNQIAYLA